VSGVITGLARPVISYPTLVFCSGVARAGISRPGTLCVGAAGRSAAVCCCGREGGGGGGGGFGFGWPVPLFRTLPLFSVAVRLGPVFASPALCVSALRGVPLLFVV